MIFSFLANKLNSQKKSLRERIKNDPYHRFNSLEDISIATELGVKIEIDKASVDDLLRLPGISIHQARSLVELINSGVEILSVEDMSAALKIPLQRLKPLEKILAFSYYDPESALIPQRININFATLEELKGISPISDLMAKEIVEHRLTKGNFKDLADLQKKLKINGKLASEIMHYLYF